MRSARATSKRNVEEVADDNCALISKVKRLEPPGGPARKVVDLVAWRCPDRSEQVTVFDSLRGVLLGAWEQGSVRDSYVPISHLHPVAVEALVEVLHFETNETVVYPAQDWPPMVVAVGTVLSRLQQLLSSPDGAPHPPSPQLLMLAAANAAGFGWEENYSTVPVFRRLLSMMPPVMVLWNSMSTHAGVPSLAQASGRTAFYANFRYGKGVAVLCDAACCVPRQVGDFITDKCCGLSVTVAPLGPMVIAIQVEASMDAEEQASCDDWLLSIWCSEVAAVLLVAGEDRHCLGARLQQSRWVPVALTLASDSAPAPCCSCWARGCSDAGLLTDTTLGVDLTLARAQFEAIPTD